MNKDIIKPENQAIQKRFTYLLSTLGMTVNEFALRIGVNKQSIYNLSKRGRLPSYDILRKIKIFVIPRTIFWLTGIVNVALLCQQVKSNPKFPMILICPFLLQLLK
jgi:DNA-binding XRE family transcriptional regulator